jgi:rod shape-determining protein MreB
MKQKESPKTEGVLHVGIDLGTSRSAISASNQEKTWIESYVGWPKDFVSQKLLGKRVLFGEDALVNRLSLEVYRPLEYGVIKEGSAKNAEAVRELIGHLIELVEPKPDQKIYAVIGVPAESFRVNKLAIKKAVAEQVYSMMVVSEPFAVAYGQDLLNNAMVIDIGAGTVDFCIMHGTMPTEEDQRTILTAGDYIDQQLFNMLHERYPSADFTRNMVRHFKESHAFVGEANGKVEVDIPVHGKPVPHDITEDMRRACESILPAIAETTTEMIAKFDPEYQAMIRNNVVLAGGGSQIRGLREHLEAILKEYGPATVRCVEDPLFGGADGSLALAKDMPAEYWDRA